MPEAFPKERPYPGTYVKLRDAAQAHQLIVVKCTDCRRVVRFLAEDLVRILDPDRDVTQPPLPCSKCGSTGRLRVDVTSAGVGDVGLMEVRRPGPVQHPDLANHEARRPLHSAQPPKAAGYRL